MDKELAAQIKAAEAAVIEAEKTHGPDAPELADKLQHYAVLLRQTEKRVLDAVNVEARARAIRAKMYAEDERVHGTSTKLEGMAKAKPPPTWAMYIGIAGVFLALSSLFINQSYLIAVLAVSFLLVIADVVLSRTSFWRVGLTIVFALSAWFSNQALPSNLLVTSSPIDRFNYASRNPEIVAHSSKLGKPTKVLSYSICLPEGFVLQGDDKRDWGRMITWLGDEGASPTGPQMALVLMKLPETPDKKQSQSLLKLARDFALPQLATILNFAELKQDDPQEIEINGMEFAKSTFKGKLNDQVRNGFAYMAINKRSLMMVIGHDSQISSDEALLEMDASVYSIKKLNDSDDLEEQS